MLIDKGCIFDAVNTFECGQCFRWNVTSPPNGEIQYTGISNGKVCHIKNGEIICDKNDENYWKYYFAFDTDYTKINDKLITSDESLKKCIDYGKGIRILRQDLWETIVSFIISANNNIPRIKKIIESICEMFGEKISDTYSEKTYYSFPTAQRLAQLEPKDLAPLRAGYRDVYILDAAQKVADNTIDLCAVKSMSDEDAKKYLMQIKGIGGKVADCILLFSLGRYSVFPTDVWIKRILRDVYGTDDNLIPEFVSKKFGNLAGYAQQYLYYYYRSNS